MTVEHFLFCDLLLLHVSQHSVCSEISIGYNIVWSGIHDETMVQRTYIMTGVLGPTRDHEQCDKLLTLQ